MRRCRKEIKSLKYEIRFHQKLDSIILWPQHLMKVVKMFFDTDEFFNQVPHVVRTRSTELQKQPQKRENESKESPKPPRRQLLSVRYDQAGPCQRTYLMARSASVSMKPLITTKKITGNEKQNDKMARLKINKKWKGLNPSVKPARSLCSN